MPVPQDVSPEDQATVDRVRAAGQDHVFTWWQSLSTTERRSLLDQLAHIDFGLLGELKETHLGRPNAGAPTLGPADVIRLPETPEEYARDARARAAGHEVLAAGGVAICLVAGGQGTRLGYDGPKGTFPISPVEGKTLFRWHAEKIHALRRRYRTALPWYIMTSAANDADTKAFFGAHDFFDLPRDEVFFFEQGMLPSLDMQGKLILDQPWHVHESPNGHGGVLFALRDSGALADMRHRGITDLFYFQVDNPLTPMADPRFLGYHRLHRADMSAKVIAKRSWDEKVGVIGTVDGRLSVIEYSDLSEEEAKRTDHQGRLFYWAGNEAVHAFSIEFIERITAEGMHLPFHRAVKAVPCLDAEGRPYMPQEKNGNKFEMFVFDALGEARHAAIVEVRREEDFAPVKNADGEDSPASAQQMLCNEFGRWLEECGVSVPRSARGDVQGRVEISPLTADSAEALKGALPSGTVFRDGLSV